MRRFFLIFLLQVTVFYAVAQMRPLTLEEATLGAGSAFRSQEMAALQWKDGDHFTYIKNADQMICYNVKSRTETTLLQLKDINTLLKAQQLQALNTLFSYRWEDPSTLRFLLPGHIFRYNILQKKIVQTISIDPAAANLHLHDASGNIAYTIDNNVHIRLSDGRMIAVTSDTDQAIVNGSNYVHRQEFGIKEGLFWSKSGHALAFYRKDERMVAEYPLVNVLTHIATCNNIRYPMAGETSEEVSLGIYHIQSGRTVFIKPFGHKNDYLTHIGWDPNDQYIYIAELNRAQDHLRFNKYDANTGRFIATLFEEKNSKWVEPENDMVFLKKNPNRFIWFSERDGYTHLYLYNSSGKLIRQLTSGSFVITDLLGFDDKEEYFYVMSTKESPLERHLYKYHIRSGKEKKLTVNAGVHNIKLSPGKKYFVDSYTSVSTPRAIKLVNTNGTELKTLRTNPDPFAANQVKLANMSTGTIKAADGITDLYYRLIKPTDFDPEKKYPVIVYVYGGPHAQLVTNSWLGGTGLFDYYLAQNGFVVFTLDNRGSANRGFAFESVIHRCNGQEEMKDQMEGVKFLKSLPFVDADKIGVSGWSYGGFMATSLITNFPETFKVAVAGGPVIDWKYYEVMYGERYMDTPQENPEGYAQTSLLKKAKDLKGRLLMIHGYQDPVVVPQNSLMFLKAATDANVLVDYSIYPTHEHNVMGKDRINLNKKITQYFTDYLK